MTDPTVELADHAVVSIRWALPGGLFHRETRAPGAVLSDLPAEVQQAIEDHWTPARVSAWEVELAAANDRGPPTSSDVNGERKRRIMAGATVTIDGYGEVPVQGGEPHERNLQGLGMAALARIMAGDTTTLTTFRDADNVDHDLTPPQMMELWQGAAARVQAIYEASWAIKALDPIPVDYDDDARWP